MKVTFIPFVFSALCSVIKGFVKGLQEYWEESWTLGEISCQTNSSERRSANADVKNTQRVITIEKQRNSLVYFRVKEINLITNTLTTL